MLIQHVMCIYVSSTFRIDCWLWFYSYSNVADGTNVHEIRAISIPVKSIQTRYVFCYMWTGTYKFLMYEGFNWKYIVHGVIITDSGVLWKVQKFDWMILVTGCNPNDLDIWTEWCRLGLQFVAYKITEQEWSFVNNFLQHLYGLQMFNLCMWRHIQYIETWFAYFQIRKLRNRKYNVLYVHSQSLSFQTGMRRRNRLKGTGRLFASC